mgnify:CR=1 FL=1
MTIDLRGYLYSIYETSILDSEIECENLIYSECICNQWELENCLEINNACYWNNPNSNANNYTEGNFCYNNESIQLQNDFSNWCTNASNDIDILIELSDYFYGDDIIEFYSTDNSNLYNSPYIYVKYNINDTSQEYVNKFHIDHINSDYIEEQSYVFNLIEDSSQMGMVLGIDNSILTFVDLNNSNNLDCEISDCNSFESSVMIDADYEGSLLTYEITLDETYSDMYSEIDFYFNNVYFVYEELDPSSDNWQDCGTDGDCSIIDEDNTQQNNVWDYGENQEGNGIWDYNDLNNNEIFDIAYDQYELFDDYGLDLCPDENEAGNNLCDQENTLYNSEGLEDNDQWDKSNDLYDDDGFCDKYECETFYDFGYDHVPDEFESGCFNNDNLFGGKLDQINFDETYTDILQTSTQDVLTLDIYTNDNGQTICGAVHWENLCSTCTTLDPNGDNYSIDPSSDDWNDCGSDNNCDIEDDDSSQGNGTWEEGEGKEKNNQYDLGERFYDYGVDGLPDVYENFDYSIQDDNWNDCGADGDCSIIDETQNNGIYDVGEGTEGNGLWEPGEQYFDYGIDQLLSYEEEGFNSTGKDGNMKYDYYDSIYKENYDDFGLDQCSNENELGNNICCELEDCEIDLGEFEDPNGDNFLIDPNNDNYDIISNPEGKENNGELDSSEDLLVLEQYYDYGYDHIINDQENNYYGNLVDIALGPNLYSFDILNSEYIEDIDNNFTDFSKPSFSANDNLGLWISSIERTGQSTYKINVNVHSYIDITAFQFQLKHIPYASEIESIENKSLYMYSPEFNDDNNNNFPETTEIIDDGLKYILDSSIYTLNELCDFDNPSCNQENNYNVNDLNIVYGHGVKSLFDFSTVINNENISLEEFIDINKNSNISNEFTNLVLYFDKSEESKHDLDKSSNIIVEYIDNENNYILFDNINSQSVTSDMDSIKINIGPIIQKYINSEIDYSKIILSSNSSSFNFSNISIIFNENDNTYNPRLELFYSK